MKRKIIAIVGPTASGKTGIGVKLAKEFDGEIISADSRQVYRGLDIGTGKEGEPAETAGISNSKFLISNQCPNDKCLNDQINDKWQMINEKLRPNLRYIDGIPQWMIDVVKPMEKMTLFDYLPLARAAIEDIFARGKTPIIVGGTGLYVQGIIEGFELEKISKNVIARLRSNEAIYHERLPRQPKDIGLARNDKKYSRTHLEQLSVKELCDILKSLDLSKYEKIDHKNTHRLIRAIELAQEGLTPIKIKPDFEVLQIAIDLPRAELHQRIDRRVDERFEQGMLEEVINLIKSGVEPEWLIGLGLEYRVITEYLLGIDYDQLSNINDQVSNEVSINQLKTIKIENLKIKDLNDHWKLIHENYSIYDSMRQKLKWKIHQFARRQITWFKRFPEVNWLSSYEEMKRFAKIYLEH